MEIIFINKPQKAVQVTEEQFNELTAELVPSNPDEAIRDVKRTLDRVNMTEEQSKKIEYIDQARSRLNTIMAVYNVRKALEATDEVTEVDLTEQRQ